jgi:hypothetical protein
MTTLFLKDRIIADDHHHSPRAHEERPTAPVPRLLTAFIRTEQRQGKFLRKPEAVHLRRSKNKTENKAQRPNPFVGQAGQAQRQLDPHIQLHGFTPYHKRKQLFLNQ